MHLNKHVFRSQQRQKSLTYEAHFFFQNIANFMYIPKRKKKIFQKVYGFLDYFISIRNGKISLLLREYS